ncbi:MAG TPA: protein kinase, partial [Bryobacteraceae bacterium]
MDRWEQIESFFHDALQCDPAERDDFVRRACRGDAALQREVASLLANHDPSGDGEPWAAAAAVRLIDPSLSLESGQCLGPYRIQSFVAAGGMGKVYRALDTRLDRTVAIKISAARFSERFEREARAIASFNHPNICQLYDVGPNYLVMELVEGPTLADRIRKGPLPMNDALGIARQVAEALEAAHTKGRVHRDLKPANVKITPEGMVKLLDFGLASAAGEPDADSDRTDSPTDRNTIVGTAAYMSPEQACGEPVDKRADIWSFGVVLMEMLTGQKAFHGGSDSEVLASVIRDDPDFGKLPRHMPAVLRKLLRRCLEKDRRRRLQAIGEARIAIDDILAGVVEPDQVAPRPAITLVAAALAVAGLAALGGAGLAAWFSKSKPDAPVMQMEITAPAGTTFGPVDGFGQVSLSPDGRQLVFIATGTDRKRRLWMRSLASGATAPLPGTEDVGVVTIWSPDGRWVGFSANRKFQRTDVVGGGAPQVICDCVAGTAAWNSEGTVLFATREQPIQIVRASGDKPVPVFGLDVSRG